MVMAIINEEGIFNPETLDLIYDLKEHSSFWIKLCEITLKLCVFTSAHPKVSKIVGIPTFLIMSTEPRKNHHQVCI